MQQTESNSIPNLDYKGFDSLYATHGLHAFAAKCPPQLANFGIQNYSMKGDFVLDPMAGSGTTLVESRLLGRNSLGLDIDPLSCLIARVKTHTLDDKQLGEAYSDLKCAISKSLKCDEANNFSSDFERYVPSEFPNLDYWFSPVTKKNLAILKFHISSTPIPEEIREFFWVAFSSIILTKVSIANARDIIHSRHHFFKHLTPPDVITKFERRVNSMRKQMIEYRYLLDQNLSARAEILNGDARRLSLENESIDLIFTSPPYATALDYPRAHFLAVGWMEEVLGISIKEYKALGTTYIGSERGHIIRGLRRDEQLADFPLANSILDRLVTIDLRQGKLIERYFADMYQSLREMKRVLKVGQYAIIVVCPSHIRKVEVPTHKIFTEMGSAMGLDLINAYTRTINANRRVLPYIRESFGNRMSTEYVLVFRKNGG